MQWFDEHGEQVPARANELKPDAGATRVHVNPRKNLTLKDARPGNTGRYQCLVTAIVADDKKITILNVLRINGQIRQPVNKYQ